jgi:hypothetical protein
MWIHVSHYHRHKHNQPDSLAGPISSQNKNSTLNRPTLTLNQYLHLSSFSLIIVNRGTISKENMTTWQIILQFFNIPENISLLFRVLSTFDIVVAMLKKVLYSSVNELCGWDYVEDCLLQYFQHYVHGSKRKTMVPDNLSPVALI